MSSSISLEPASTYDMSTDHSYVPATPPLLQSYISSDEDDDDSIGPEIDEWLRPLYFQPSDIVSRDSGVANGILSEGDLKKGIQALRCPFWLEGGTRHKDSCALGYEGGAENRRGLSSIFWGWGIPGRGKPFLESVVMDRLFEASTKHMQRTSNRQRYSSKMGRVPTLAPPRSASVSWLNLTSSPAYLQIFGAGREERRKEGINPSGRLMCCDSYKCLLKNSGWKGEGSPGIATQNIIARDSSYPTQETSSPHTDMVINSDYFRLRFCTTDFFEDCSNCEEERGKKDKKHILGKRPAQEEFASTSQEDSEYNHPRFKKLKAERGGQAKSHRPFACPYYKRSPLKHSDCAGWHDTKLDQLKEHLKNTHIKPILCGRCNIFRAGNYKEVTQHLRNENCKKSEALEFEIDTAMEKAEDVDKARTWQEIYELLFPSRIPDPSWRGCFEAFMTPLKESQLLFMLRVRAAISFNKQEYQLGLAEFLGDRLGLGESAAYELLREYDDHWTSMIAERQLPSLLGDSVDYGCDIPIRYLSTQSQDSYNSKNLSILQDGLSCQSVNNTIVKYFS